MSKYDQKDEGPAKKELPAEDSAKTGKKEMLENTKGRKRYDDMQSAARFPLKLPVALKSETGRQSAETQNISANGVLFQVDAEMPVGSMVDFTISLPAEVMGSSIAGGAWCGTLTKMAGTGWAWSSTNIVLTAVKGGR